MAKCLIKNRGVSSSKIAILSPYKEQQARIRKALAETSQCKDICVTTIAKSQGKATFVSFTIVVYRYISSVLCDPISYRKLLGQRSKPESHVLASSLTANNTKRANLT